MGIKYFFRHQPRSVESNSWNGISDFRETRRSIKKKANSMMEWDKKIYIYIFMYICIYTYIHISNIDTC